MSKRKPGLPPDYRLPITAKDLEDSPPADVGDFLDEDDSFSPSPQPTQLDAAPTRSANVVHIRRPVEITPVVPSQSAQQPAQESSIAGPATAGVRKPPPRKQINMTPQVIEWADELLHRIQTCSQNKHAKTSEMFHALVAAAYEARHELDLTRVPARGRWGSQTAQIFVDSLKTSFQQAIARRQRQKGEGTY